MPGLLGMQHDFGTMLDPKRTPTDRHSNHIKFVCEQYTCARVHALWMHCRQEEKRISDNALLLSSGLHTGFGARGGGQIELPKIIRGGGGQCNMGSTI